MTIILQRTEIKLSPYSLHRFKRSSVIHFIVPFEYVVCTKESTSAPKSLCQNIWKGVPFVRITTRAERQCRVRRLYRANGGSGPTSRPTVMGFCPFISVDSPLQDDARRIHTLAIAYNATHMLHTAHKRAFVWFQKLFNTHENCACVYECLL